MKRVMKWAFVAAGVALLAGCAASGPKFAEMSSTIPQVKEGQGRVYFFRSSSMLGAAVQPEIRLNDQVVGKSQPGGFFYVDGAKGTYKAAASTETEKTLSFTLDAGETKYVREEVSMGVLVGRIVLTLESAEKALAELAKLHYTGGADDKVARK
ncbi:DUF2846 domain-containing protein [Achromobacter aloeverae]|uniref:DUF2846 domain-containing protein n=1 Tax=Achromobacter aloeverae TaxID=1750518 RepID=A0A4Q1HN78_9BURK|nr:DUF2846 domain-containing protein [Achromobacter aloeverae]RXN92349.1 hypothetical protein C7R54_00860 [Achromobacter aloeverae]